MNSVQDLNRQLSEMFERSLEIYKNRGFGRKIGYGTAPAIINVDIANAWTKPGYPFTCDGMDELVRNVRSMLDVARPKKIPIVYTTTAYQFVEGKNTDMGLWHHKVPNEILKLGTDVVEIDDRLGRLPDEQVIVKKRASAFHGTFLAGYLRSIGVDTVIVTGVTMTSCVRHTVEDAIAEGFRPIIPRECVGDRIPGAIAWNLFDIEAKFGDVESLASVIEYLKSVKQFIN
jgi:N-carbamoylsarcosine amidase